MFFEAERVLYISNIPNFVQTQSKNCTKYNFRYFLYIRTKILFQIYSHTLKRSYESQLRKLILMPANEYIACICVKYTPLCLYQISLNNLSWFSFFFLWNVCLDKLLVCCVSPHTLGMSPCKIFFKLPAKHKGIYKGIIFT